VSDRPTLRLETFKDAKIVLSPVHIIMGIGWLFSMGLLFVPMFLLVRDGVKTANENEGAIEVMAEEVDEVHGHIYEVQTQLTIIGCYHANRALELRGTALPEECR